MLYNPITSLADEHYLGFFVDSAALNTAHPTAGDGDFAIVGATDTVWVWNDTTTLWVDSGSAATGNVVGPVSATDNAVARYDSTTGKIIQNSTVTIDDDGVIGASGVNLIDDTSAGFSFEKTGANAGVFQIYNDGFANVVGPGSSPSRRFAFYDQMGAGAGSESLPPFTNFNDTNTGMYFPANDEIGFSVGGSEAVHITPAGITATNLSGTNTGDQTAITTPNTPAGTISATTVQAALNELDTEKVPGTQNIGYMNIPQNSQSVAYTTVLTDAGKHIYHPSADTTDRVWTIDSNANVPYPIGTALTFVNDISAGVITIDITSDTMYLAGAGTTGGRTLAACGIATAIKKTSTSWIISGTGLT